jgi:alcohol/geraniol dehydrogenase (NADP+)
MYIYSYAVHAPKQLLQPFSYDKAELGPKEIEIAITHCGICHSDIHLIDNDWKNSVYPLVPGHEIVGMVDAIGPEVTHLRVGQRVGIGWQSGSCFECEMCGTGNENLCAQNQATCNGHYGGFAHEVRTDSRFAFPIPNDMDSETAAPLLCGGVTVYSPFRSNNVRPHSKVGIVGIGGLGHMAVQFARAFGCEVTAFSTSADKEAEAHELGAHRFVLSNDPDQMAAAANSLDFILSTVFVQLDWGAFMKTLRPFGTLCFVGAGGMLNIPVNALMSKKKTVTGSIIGGRSVIQEMLEFSARHNIRAITEAMPLSEVNEAVQKVREGKARYRMVLTV